MKTQALLSPGDRLKYIRSILRVSRAYLQKKYNLPEVTLKAWENGTIKITSSGIKRCIETYKHEGLLVSEEWILEGIGLDPTLQIAVGQYFSIPALSSLSELPSTDDAISMIQEANIFKEKHPNAIVMMVCNDEMRPFFKPGDYIGGKMRFGEEIQSCINKNCIIKLKNASLYFRRVIKNSKNNYNLCCLNPDENTEEPILFDLKLDEIEGVAPVIWHRQKDGS